MKQIVDNFKMFYCIQFQKIGTEYFLGPSVFRGSQPRGFEQTWRIMRIALYNGMSMNESKDYVLVKARQVIFCNKQRCTEMYFSRNTCVFDVTSDRTDFPPFRRSTNNKSNKYIVQCLSFFLFFYCYYHQFKVWNNMHYKRTNLDSIYILLYLRDVIWVTSYIYLVKI